MSKTESKVKIRDLTVTAVFAAILCIISPFSIPIGPVGITVAPFGVYLSGAVLGWKRGGIAVAVYLILGFIGLPVFSGFMGGIQRLAGPTGGYLVGYIPCAVITGLFADRISKKWAAPVGMLLGTATLYAFGTAWFCVMSGTGVLPALGTCVLPFLPGDAVKIACAAGIAGKVRGLESRG